MLFTKNTLSNGLNWRRRLLSKSFFKCSNSYRISFSENSCGSCARRSNLKIETNRNFHIFRESPQLSFVKMNENAMQKFNSKDSYKKTILSIFYQDPKFQAISKSKIKPPTQITEEHPETLCKPLRKPSQYFQTIVRNSLSGNVTDSGIAKNLPLLRPPLVNISNQTARSYTTSSQTDPNVNCSDKPEESPNVVKIKPLFRAPKNVLHNVFDFISNELKKQDLKLAPQYKTVVVGKKSNWTCTYNIKWPETISFSEVAVTKKEASNKAASSVLSWLKEHGKIDKEGRPLIYNKEAVTKLTKKTYPTIWFEPNVQEGLSEITDIYKNQLVSRLVADLDGTRPQEEEIATTTKEIEEKWPRTYRQQFMGVQHYLAPEPNPLPISEYKEDFIKLLRDTRVLIVKGEPGCGKSIRVPQFVMEAWARDEDPKKPCRIIVSEPRRIAAISLAERVAYERQENVGSTVGYQVRLKSNFDNRTGRIMYCTTGILLRRLQSDPSLSDCSHVILDEAHERDVNTDLLMNLLRLGLKLNPDLKLLIMSATIEAETFQDYFGGAPVLHVPGFTYPVQDLFLEEHGSDFRKTHKMCTEAGGTNPFVVPEEVADAIVKVHGTKPDESGAILCFLPGWDEIIKVKKLLADQDGIAVLCLHSKLQIKEQRMVFERPPPGVRKVILATNIAETSVTIDDVVYVIDTGIHKEERFDVEKGLSCIDNHWISRASATQRKGRAGRCQPGTCFRLYPKSRYQQFEPHTTPEILRTSLTKIVLDSKVYSNNADAVVFLEQLISPPERDAVQKAVEELKELEMLEDDETLSPLGRVVSDFQLPPKLSKAMVNAVVFKCVTPVVDVATLYSANTTLFTETSDGVRDVKLGFSTDSDHLAMIRLFETWLGYVESGRVYEAEEFCLRRGLVHYKLNMLRKIRNIHFEYLRKGLHDVLPLSDDQSDNDELVKAVLLSGVGTVLQHRTWDINKGRLKKANVFVTRHKHKATITSESVNCRKKHFPSDFLFYLNETRSNLRHTTLIRETSLISPLAVLLFSSKDLEIENVPAEDFSKEIKSTDQVLMKLKGTEIKFICDRGQALEVQKCKDVLRACVQYYVYQLTKGNDYSPEVNRAWKDVLGVLNRFLTPPTSKRR